MVIRVRLFMFCSQIVLLRKLGTALAGFLRAIHVKQGDRTGRRLDAPCKP